MKFNKKTIGMAVGVACAAMMTAPAQAFEFGAMGDASYSTSDDDAVSSAFAIGGLDLYARQDIDPNTEAFIEYVFENDGEGFVLDLERMYVKRNINDSVRVGIGRMHSPLGYWNNTFHHGVIMQDTASRPSFLDFEDGEAAILPTHVIGVTVEGQAGNLGYEVSLANSTFLDTTVAGPEIGIGNISDYSDDKTVFARLTYEVSGVNLGLSLMNNSIVEAAAAGGTLAQGEELIAQSVTGLDARYKYNQLSLLAEYFMMTNDSQAGVGDSASHDATAYYVQASYQVNDKFRPTVRYESLEADVATDAYFTILGRQEYTANVVALRYDLDDSNALTFEYKATSPDGGTDVTEMTLDWSFLMF